jgi:hypothetical protein
MGKYLDLAEQVALNRPTAPPPDELGEPCAYCGATDKWRWIDGRLLCRACLIREAHPIEVVAAASQPERPRQWW